MDSPAELQKSNRNLCAQIKIALLFGTVMSFAVVILCFLLSKSTVSLGETILITTAALIILNTLVFVIVKNAHKTLKISVTVFMILFNVIVFFSITIYTVAPSQLFYPHFDEASYTELKTRSETEELTVETKDGATSGWLLNNAGKNAPLVLCFYGNGENASSRMLKIIDNGSLKTYSGYNIAIFDYPGYGKTSGHPSEETLKAFGLTVFDALTQRDDVDKDRIVVFGYSIGTGVANYVASKRNVSGLILMAPYADGYDLYNGFVNIFHGPFRNLVAFRMESVKFAADVSVNPLILASKSDEFVSYDSSVRLSHAFPSGCTFKTLENTRHNDFWGSSAAMRYISEYLAEVNAK